MSMYVHMGMCTYMDIMSMRMSMTHMHMCIFSVREHMLPGQPPNATFAPELTPEKLG